MLPSMPRRPCGYNPIELSRFAVGIHPLVFQSGPGFSPRLSAPPEGPAVAFETWLGPRRAEPAHCYRRSVRSHFVPVLGLARGDSTPHLTWYTSAGSTATG